MEILMDLNKELNDLSERIQGYIDNNQVKGEQATINYLIKPFLRLLGFDDSNPAEVVPEFTADIGTKKGEKVDLAIYKESKVIMLIECKDCNTELSQEEFSQLYRYFGVVTEARIGVLTNGIQYRFYTDLIRLNVMDTDPFFEFNILDMHPSVVNVLNYLTKDKFDLDITRSTAIDLKERRDIKQILMKQLETPTNDIVEFFHKAINSQVEKQDFTDIVKRAFNEFMDEQNTLQSNVIYEEIRSNDNDGDKVSNGVDEETGNKDTGIRRLTNIRVTMPDGSVIYHHNAKETYLEVLEKLGLEKVSRVRPNIVSTEQFSYSDKCEKRGEFWVRGLEFNTYDRIVELKRISNQLNVSLKIEQVEKNSKSD